MYIHTQTHTGLDTAILRHKNALLEHYGKSMVALAAAPAKRCSSLQHAATHCNITTNNTPLLEFAGALATHCNTLQHTATHCNTLQHTATHGKSATHNTPLLELTGVPAPEREGVVVGGEGEREDERNKGVGEEGGEVGGRVGGEGGRGGEDTRGVNEFDAISSSR